MRRSHIDGMGDLTVQSLLASHVCSERLRILDTAVGGFISAQFQLAARQLGNNLATETSVEVSSPEGSLEAGCAYPGVALAVGGERIIVDVLQRPMAMGGHPAKGGEDT
ncbi:hypothetical protein [Sulfobacillus harzensis]|uniref:Uncharacterized protein n=1 Tax=Sulfobacillus harzensis TaxID=2729629 RepID=A0A7Y0Q392_9FIRM|nr:hypothetical protein [Sulfobacillus harzensis]NMP22726.1 hypothetical protein [Sulfobacillus harzensis]